MPGVIVLFLCHQTNVSSLSPSYQSLPYSARTRTPIIFDMPFSSLITVTGGLQVALRHLPVHPVPDMHLFFQRPVSFLLLLVLSCTRRGLLIHKEELAQISSTRGPKTFTFWRATTPQTVPSAEEYYPWRQKGRIVRDCDEAYPLLQYLTDFLEEGSGLCPCAAPAMIGTPWLIYMMLNCAFFVNT